MKKINKLIVVTSTVGLLFGGCHTFKHCEYCSFDKSFIIRDELLKPKIFIYKPGCQAPAYLFHLPNNCTGWYIYVGNTCDYLFECDSSILFVTDGHCDLDTNYNTLLTLSDRLFNNDTVISPTKGILDYHGTGNEGFWRYILLYDISKESTTGWGFERLYVGYKNASERDTGELNVFVNTYALIDSVTYRYYDSLRSNKPGARCRYNVPKN